MKNLPITLLASVFLLIVFSHGRQGAALGQNQQPESRIRVTLPGIPGGGLSGAIDAYGYSGGIVGAVPPQSLTLEDLSFTKGIDKATPILSQKVADGSTISNAKVEVYRVDPNTQIETLYLRITMPKVRVTSSSPALDTSKSLSSAVEQMTLCYTAITYTYKFPTPPGDKVFNYDRHIQSC